MKRTIPRRTKGSHAPLRARRRDFPAPDATTEVDTLHVPDPIFDRATGPFRGAHRALDEES